MSSAHWEVSACALIFKETIINEAYIFYSPAPMLKKTEFRIDVASLIPVFGLIGIIPILGDRVYDI